MMRSLPGLLCLLAILHTSYAPPVSGDNSNEDSDVKDNLEEYMEYHRYLKEVVQALESDPDFRERLEKADVEDVRSGKIADQLDFVNHNVRTKLDEIKRRELERLRHLATKQYELTNNLDAHMGKVPINEHLDQANPHTFEIEDLKRLIKKTTSDLEEADKQRKEEFKEYEMQKEFEKHQKLETMNEDQKKEYMKKENEEKSAKKHHKPLHHPGSKQQLEEVWEKQDHMDQQFDPKAFFMMHDVDGNGAWDADEVKALFIKELDKLYGPGGPNKDLHERAEEMERMREHVFQENDKNHDGLIDFQEFMVETQKANFNRDEGWKSIDENQIYTQAEYEAYERRRLEELRYLQQRGLVDAHGRPIPGTQHKLHEAYQQYPAYQQQQYQQQQYQQQQYQQPPSHQGQQYYPQGQMPPVQGQVPQGYQPAPGQIPPQGYQQHTGQVPQQAYQAQYQIPQGQPQGQYPGQPQGQYQGQPQGQYQGQQQGQYQGQQQGQYQGQQQGQYQGQPQGQHQGQPQGQHQGQPQGQHQGQPQGQHQGQVPPQPGQSQGQYQGQVPQQPQAGNINQGQAPQAQPAQGQGAPAQGQASSVQGQASPVQGQAQQAQPQQNVQGQPQQNAPPQSSQNQGQAAPAQGQNAVPPPIDASRH
ncbi:nucleobindin-2 isoform X2 [Galleria mellonella]|uniref:Nucleobindin-2 isoform X2 n=1 Tax=Galleria mellonella TaxID=7137 RepID=A0A6J1WV75_GALME|nr:nucleobindin-2 isoform X2 [Galleria mellonella]